MHRTSNKEFESLSFAILDYFTLVSYASKYNYETSVFRHFRDLNCEFVRAIDTENY